MARVLRGHRAPLVAAMAGVRRDPGAGPRRRLREFLHLLEGVDLRVLFVTSRTGGDGTSKTPSRCTDGGESDAGAPTANEVTAAASRPPKPPRNVGSALYVGASLSTSKVGLSTPPANPQAFLQTSLAVTSPRWPQRVSGSSATHAQSRDPSNKALRPFFVHSLTCVWFLCHL